MVDRANRTLLAACVAALLAAAPAAADPATTGGLPAGEPPVLGESGGLAGPAPAPEPGAVVAQNGDEPPPAEEPPTTDTPEPTTPPADEESTVDVPVDDAPRPGEGAARPAAEVTDAGSPLPHTGFALAALVALGTCFFLTGYALRYSRALD